MGKQSRSLECGPGCAPWGTTDAIDVEDYRNEWSSTCDVDPDTVRFVQGRAEALPYRDSTFGFVRAGQVIGPYAPLEQSLFEAVRVLGPKGVLSLRVLGRDVNEVLEALKVLGMQIKKVEREGYEDEYDDDWVEIVAKNKDVRGLNR